MRDGYIYFIFLIVELADHYTINGNTRVASCQKNSLISLTEAAFSNMFSRCLINFRRCSHGEITGSVS